MAVNGDYVQRAPTWEGRGMYAQDAGNAGRSACADGRVVSQFGVARPEVLPQFVPHLPGRGLTDSASVGSLCSFVEGARGVSLPYVMGTRARFTRLRDRP